MTQLGIIERLEDLIDAFERRAMGMQLPYEQEKLRLEEAKIAMRDLRAIPTTPATSDEGWVTKPCRAAEGHELVMQEYFPGIYRIVCQCGRAGITAETKVMAARLWDQMNPAPINVTSNEGE